MGIKYNGKVYNNLQGQVAQNTEDIEKIKNAGVIGYEAGDGIDIVSGVISVDTDVIQEKIEANPTEASTATLNKLKVDDVVYALGGGGGEPAAYIKQAVVNQAGDTLTLTKKDDSTVVFNPSIAAGTVTSVNEKTGAVVLDAEDVGVSGTNDGTNWTTLTIDDETYAIPAGGSGGSGVTDVKVNNVSCVTNHVANVPVANGANLGVVKGAPKINAQLAIAGIDSTGYVWYAETSGQYDVNASDQWKSIESKVTEDGAMVRKYIPRVSTSNAGSGAQELHSVYVGDTQYALPSGGSGGSTTVGGGNGIEVTGTASSGYTVSAKANSENNGIAVTSSGIGVNFNAVQAKLTAGTNVQINGATISATDTTYTAGSNIQINSSNVISATDTNTITTLHNDDNTVNIVDEGVGNYSYDVSVKYKANAGLAVDGSNGLYVNSVNGLKFQVVQTEPGEPAANTIYFIFQQ